MDVVKTLRTCMKVLGINANNGKIDARIYLYIVIQITMLVNTGCFLVSRWDQIDDRILGFKVISFILTFFIYNWSVLAYWEDFHSMLGIHFGEKYKIPYKITEERKKMINAFVFEKNKFNEAWWKLITVYVLFTTILPLFVVVLKVCLFSEDFYSIIQENSATPYPLHYPEFIVRSGQYRTLLNTLVYAIGYTTHSIYIIMTGFFAQLVYVTAMCGIVEIEFELKLLKLSLQEADSIEGMSLVSTENIQLKTSSKDTLYFFVRYFVRHHQEMYRKFDVVNRGVRWTAITLCTEVSLYVCASLYTIAQKDQIILKLQEAIFGAVWASGMLLFDICGERMKTQAENLRNALYESNWFAKPYWYKKMLLVMMTRTSKPFDIKPFGLYGFNLNSYSKTMNAAYCYYNVLCRLKDK